MNIHSLPAPSVWGYRWRWVPRLPIRNGLGRRRRPEPQPGELATLAQEKANVTLLIMNDGGYGVMRGIQDKYFGGRQYYNELHTPDFSCWRRRWVCRRGAWIGLRISVVMTEALAMPGPSVVEVKMGQIGALRFAGPPRRRCINDNPVTPTSPLGEVPHGTGVNQGAGLLLLRAGRGPAHWRGFIIWLKHVKRIFDEPHFPLTL